MKKLCFVVLVILIVLFPQFSLYAAKRTASLVITGIVHPRVSMSIIETTNTRSINSQEGTGKLQLFTMNDSGNLENGYQVVLESKNAVQHQNESPFFTDPNSDGSHWGYTVYFNNQSLDFSSGWAVAKPIGHYKSSENGSSITIVASENDTTRLEGHYSDTLIIKVIAN